LYVFGLFWPSIREIVLHPPLHGTKKKEVSYLIDSVLSLVKVLFLESVTTGFRFLMSSQNPRTGAGSGAFLCPVSTKTDGTDGTGGTALIRKGFFCAAMFFSDGTDGTKHKARHQPATSPRPAPAPGCSLGLAMLRFVRLWPVLAVDSECQA
jgi:hypothetical protein